jgi:hypothetical protein
VRRRTPFSYPLSRGLPMDQGNNRTYAADALIKIKVQLSWLDVFGPTCELCGPVSIIILRDEPAILWFREDLQRQAPQQELRGCSLAALSLWLLAGKAQPIRHARQFRKRGRLHLAH